MSETTLPTQNHEDPRSQRFNHVISTNTSVEKLPTIVRRSQILPERVSPRTLEQSPTYFRRGIANVQRPRALVPLQLRLANMQKQIKYPQYSMVVDQPIGKRLFLMNGPVNMPRADPARYHRKLRVERYESRPMRIL